ncbi:MAG: argininosuccinate lyase [Deltaproteobacteria bacterium]|nr:argininosuccinate lyase [Deltaproteobacteria bacterium]
MVKPLWDKGAASPDDRMQRFCAGDDVSWDRALFPHDIRASRAHVRGLLRIGLLTEAECAALCNGLDELHAAFGAGTFVLDARYEDGHTAIEAFLGEMLGETGRKVHTGRSRNDQVLVAQRLYLKEALTTLLTEELDIAGTCLQRARLTMDVPMPGYTHMQRAVPSSVGAWFAAFAEGFTENAFVALAARDAADACPLGTAAGYGVNLALDRQGVAQELGFSRVLVSPIYAQNSRGKVERLALEALHQALLDTRRLAWDLALFVTSEFAFARLPEAFTTGSSIMPNKRNPDVVELLRQLAAVTSGALAELDATLSLPSGYQRDLQGTKAPVIRALSRGLDGLSLLPRLLDGVEFDALRMNVAISPEMFATDRAMELARSGVPFRDAYGRAAVEIVGAAAVTAEQSLAARVSLGGMGNPGLDVVEKRLAEATAAADQRSGTGESGR